MQNQTTKKEDVSSQLQDYANETDKPSYLVEREEMEGTPFMLVKQNEKFFATLGQYRITPEFEYRIDVYDYIESDMYNVILDMITAVIDHVNKLENQKNHKTI